MTEQLPDVGTTVFVLSEDTFEYDDNYYSRISDGGGRPISAFRTKERAEEEAIKLLINTLQSEYFELENYGAFALDEIFWGANERVDPFCDVYATVNPADAETIRGGDADRELLGRFKRSFILLHEDDKRAIASHFVNFFYSITPIEVTE